MEAAAILHLECAGCRRQLPAEPHPYTCPECGQNLSYRFDYDHIAADWSREKLARDGDRSIWRYLPLLPVQRKPRQTALSVGNTPLVPCKKLAERYGIKEMWIKDDTRLPSLSLKDRASELAIRHAAESGMETIIGASTGNAGASLACLAAYHGQHAVLCIPADAPAAKLVQIRQHGATLLPIEANYDTAFDLAFELSKRLGWYCRNTGINPILAEGKKTAALEMAEQLDWHIPDRVLVPVGDGCIISGLYRGFEDLTQLGWIEGIPQLVAIQAEGSAAIVNSLDYEGAIKPVRAETIADSISVDLPRDGLKARKAIRNSKGLGMTVTDEEILEAQKMLAGECGIFAEPAAASVMAGCMKMFEEGVFGHDESIVLLVTGSGLKDIPHAQQSLGGIEPLPPDIEALQSYLEANAGKVDLD